MLKLIKSLKATSKRTEKEAILSGLAGDEKDLFLKVAIAAYDTSINYQIAKPKMPTSYAGTKELGSAINNLSVLRDRVLTGNSAREFLTDLLQSLSEDDAKVLEMVVKHDLDCGVTASTINKIWPDTIYEHPYCRCTSFSVKAISGVKLPCYSQTKEDGLYIDIIVTDTEVTYMTRSGQVVNKYGSFSKNDRLRKIKKDNGLDSFVLMGEALVLNENGDYLNRQEGNGYLNSDDVDPDLVVFALWDMVPLKDWKAKSSNVPYHERLDNLIYHVTGSKSFKLVDTKVVTSVQQIIDHFKENVLNGKEGTVVKDFDAMWKDGTSAKQIKLKIEFDCELKVVGIEEGDKKNKGRLGALVCESECGKVKVNVGSGFTDKQRISFFTEEMIGTIITGRANDVIHTEKGISLFLPRFVELRTDKKEADTYERILEQRDAFVDAIGAIGGNIDVRTE